MDVIKSIRTIGGLLGRYNPEKEPAAPDTASQGGTPAPLSVTVLFTGMDHTIAALRKAERLASGLDARILLLVPVVVPYALPLTEPPVRPDFLVRKLCGVMGHQPGTTGICVCLCRDLRQACREVLKPESLVMIGGRRRWWRTREQGIARELGEIGRA